MRWNMARIKLNEAAKKGGIKAKRERVRSADKAYKPFIEEADRCIAEGRRRNSHAYQSAASFLVR